MRCIACDRLLDDAEATNKYMVDGVVYYHDMCRWCLHASGTHTNLEDDIIDRDYISYDDNGGAEDEDPYGDEIEW